MGNICIMHQIVKRDRVMIVNYKNYFSFHIEFIRKEVYR